MDFWAQNLTSKRNKGSMCMCVCAVESLAVVGQTKRIHKNILFRLCIETMAS